MTIGTILTITIVALLIAGTGMYYGRNLDKRGRIITTLICTMLVCATVGVGFFYANTAIGRRALKSQKSNFNNGIQRTVRVYDVEGDIIEEYEGKFDIEYDSDRILFDDEHGKRHIIYYTTGTVIIDEK